MEVMVGLPTGSATALVIPSLVAAASVEVVVVRATIFVVGVVVLALGLLHLFFLDGIHPTSPAVALISSAAIESTLGRLA